MVLQLTKQCDARTMPLSHCYGFLLPIDTRGGGAIAADPGVKAEVDQDHREGEGGLLIELISVFYLKHTLIVSPNTIEIGGLLIELNQCFT